jgi:heavy metal sensor kinase
MFSSIRFKLTLWYTCFLALIISAFSIFTYVLLDRALDEQTDENIVGISKSVESAVQGEEADEEHSAAITPDAAISEALDEFHSPDYSFVVIGADGTPVADREKLSLLLPRDLADGSLAVQRINRKPFKIGRFVMSVGGARYDLFVVYSLSDQRELEESVRDIFLAIVPIALILAAIGGYFLARRNLAPIAEMSSRAARINAANLNEPLPIRNPQDELGSLGIAFNELLMRLDREFDRQRRFMTDASHELRTPLAIIRGESDVALLNQERGAAEYRDALSVVSQESKRLSGIVEDLFTLARADSGSLAPDLREVYVDEILSECVRAVRTLADQRAISIHLDTQELPIRGDEALLRRLFMNLLDNAIKYNYDGGNIRIVTKGHLVKIGNTGKLIPESEVEHIFERFYRLDKAHMGGELSQTSGAGLGLSISKVIADIHGATLAYEHIGIENLFTVAFPEAF